MADLAALQRSIYDEQRQTWGPVQDALLDDYNDFSGRTDRIAEAGQEAALATAQNEAATSRQLARFGPQTADGMAYRTRMQNLQTPKDVVAARGMARDSEEARRVDTGLALTQMGGDTLGQGMTSLALADGMKRQREEADAAKKRSKKRGIGGLVGMAAGAGMGAFFGPVGAMAGAQVGGSIGGALA